MKHYKHMKTILNMCIYISRKWQEYLTLSKRPDIFDGRVFDRVHTPQVVRKADRKRRRESSIEDDWRDQWYNYLQETKRIEQRHHDRVFPEKCSIGFAEFTKFDCTGEHCPCRSGASTTKSS